jgi:hypothetical protein
MINGESNLRKQSTFIHEKQSLTRLRAICEIVGECWGSRLANHERLELDKKGWNNGTQCGITKGRGS